MRGWSAAVALLCFAPPLSAGRVEVKPSEARVRAMGRLLEDGGFSFWTDGYIGERFAAEREGTAGLRVLASGKTVGGEPPIIAVEVQSAAGAFQEVGRIRVESSAKAEYRMDAAVPCGPFELRLRQTNREAGDGALRHLVLRGFSLDGVTRYDGSLLAHGMFGEGGTGPAASGSVQRVSAGDLRAEIYPQSGFWRVMDASLGCALEGVRPVLQIDGLPVNLKDYRVEVDAAADASGPAGAAERITLHYRRPGGLEIDYWLWFGREHGEVVARMDFANGTGRKLVVARMAPVVCGGISLGGLVDGWALLSDGRANDEPHRLVAGRELGELEGWWHMAMKDRSSGRAFVAGSLTNHKGLGRFLATRADARSVRLAAYSDYEGIEMPPGAKVQGEAFLLAFSANGNEGLERFGELVARAHGIDLRRDHPLDTGTAKGAALFTAWNNWGASVIKGFQYTFDRSKGQRAHEDPAWNQANQRKIRELGLDRFGYAAGKGAGIVGLGTPLARRYGNPDFWFKEAREIGGAHPDWYRDGRIDFSNPDVVAFERERVGRMFAGASGTGRYAWDFTDRWARLEGQRNPFMTSAETYRAAMGVWRDAAKAHAGGAYAFVWMNVVGLNYGLADVIHTGHDSDNGYGGDGLTFTHGLTRQISGRYFYNGRVWWNSPDSFHVYAGGIYSAPQARAHASFCAIAGNLVHLGEPFANQETPPDRVEIIRRVSPTTADVARAVDVFENNPARLWAMPVQRNFGRWTVAGLFNVDFDGKGESITQEVRLADLGLEEGKEYLVYEFWGDHFLGAVKGGFVRTIAGPGCEVYAIVENPSRPALVSTSRHVRQMAVDILDCRWDDSERVLRGRSRVIAGDRYQLRIHVPQGFRPAEAVVGGAAAKTTMHGPILRVDVPEAVAGDVAWEVAFRAGS